MGSDADTNPTQTAAIVALFLVLLIPVAVALAWWFKRRYAQAVVRLQAVAAGAQAAAKAPTLPPPLRGSAAGVPPLQMTLLPAAAITASGADPTRAARQLRRRVLRVQFLLGLAYWCGLLLLAAIALFIYLELAGTFKDANPAQDTMLAAASAWIVMLTIVIVPPALAWALQAGVQQAMVWWIVVAASVVMGGALALSGQGLLGVLATPVVLSLMGLTMTAFLRPAVRGAGPPLMAAMIVAFLVFVTLSAVAVLLDDGGGDEWGHWTDVLLEGLLLLLGLAVSGAVGWRMLLRIARRYSKKRFSEVQLALGTYWGLMTLFTLAAVLLLSFEKKTGGLMEWVGLLVVVLWLAWRGFQRLALRWAVRRAPSPLGALLLLRVFKPSQRSEAFIDRFLARWRFAAPVWMIAGPDLAGALMEPDEFFAYLRRRLAERFVSDAGQIPQRLAELDGARDPDGRFRVSELYCADSTWQPAVLAMIERAGVILLDLREYTASRAGTRYELQQLLSRAPLERVLVLTDEAGDAPQLRAAIADAWRSVGRRTGQSVNIVQLRSESDAELDGLFRITAASDGGPAPSEAALHAHSSISTPPILNG